MDDDKLKRSEKHGYKVEKQPEEKGTDADE